MQTQVDELTLLIETLSKGKQKEMDLKDTIIDWSNVSLENPETPQKRHRETLESPQKSRYMPQSDVFRLRYDGYDVASSSKSATYSPQLEYSRS